MSAEDEANLGNEEGAGGEEEEQELGEGWVGVSRPAKPRTPPPVADRTNRPTLYSTMAVKESAFDVARSRVLCVERRTEFGEKRFRDFCFCFFAAVFLGARYAVHRCGVLLCCG